jgi:hypothetical protein
MDLKDFVAQAITSVLAGVAEAQKGDLGLLVGPTFRFSMDHKKDMLGVIVHGSDNHTIMQFDIAVTTTKEGEAGTRIKVFDLVEAGGKGALGH